MRETKLVAIHQPNFFPWLGYFNKIAQANVFVILDDAQFPKTGGSWINHVMVLISGQPKWMTVPVVRAYHGVREIREIEINNSTDWRSKLLKTISMNYRRAPHFDSIFPLVDTLINTPAATLGEYNITNLRALMQALGLDVQKLVLSSTLDILLAGTERLIAITQAVGGTAYIVGGGASTYQDDSEFSRHNIQLVYQNFEHPTYPQKHSAAFVPGLSILDVLFQCGLEQTSALIQTRQ